ncbi:hypothetical protein [Kitasatospora viridis]|uniref:Uncharacterized protein n=1 Tax=Kitasatospora viridis TaxID=281105 RepID=A0A561UN37_9ACTN|nr:hypothetical protein [Kitasatospora viridis]TWG00767.1 hypothetical protein FHX73_114647 [Kitasatospora viridis]
MENVTPEQSGRVLWRGRLGKKDVEVREVDGRCTLRAGDRSTVLDDRSTVRHRQGLLRNRIIVERPGEPAFVYRYRLHWMAQVYSPMFEGSYDRWSAEADDPGLGLVELLGGTDDWT